ncbi:MAG: RNA-directed DNA polymerase [Candidatus Manganitrophaceae bacterium]
MKRYGNLYARICAFENLFLAAKKAQKGKRFNERVARFHLDLENELLRLQEELLHKTYTPGPYRTFSIYERKPRQISAAPYRDRVVHHALCNIIEPLFDHTFIHDSYACRTGKGTHKAVARLTAFSRQKKFVLKCDIKKYFPSIDHERLFEKIRRKIKCPDTLWLIKTIIDHSNPQHEVFDYFQEDNLFEPFERRRGIPIGNLTSQFFANVYLSDLDHFIKEVLKCRFYIRYVDDLTVLEDRKERLWEIKNAIEAFLERDRLKLHPKKTSLFPVTVGADHLGYRVFPTHRLLRKDTSMRFDRKLRRMGKFYRDGLISWGEINSRVQSWLGHAKHADTYGLRKKLFTGIIFRHQII